MHLRADARAAHGCAWWCRHPLEKALLALVVVAAGLAGRTPATNLATALVSLAVLLAFARVPWRSVLRTVWVPAGVVLVGALAVPVEVSSGGVSWHADRVGAMMLIVTRSLACTVGALLLGLTTDLGDLLHALGRAGVPPWFLDLVSVMGRFVGVLGERIEVMRAAQAARFGYVDARAARRSVVSLAAGALAHSSAMATRIELGYATRGLQFSLPSAGHYDRPRPASALACALALSAPAVLGAVAGFTR